MEEEKQVVPQKNEGLDTAADEIKMAVFGKQSVLQQGLISLSVTTNQDYVRISVNTPEGKKRVPTDIVCVLDISGSMAAEAHVKNTEGVKEKHGLSYLDLLKHAVKTIVSNLSEQDRFALVSYSDEARVEFKLGNMTDDQRQLAIIAVDNLETEGSTNIWGGVFEALEMLRNDPQKGNNQSIMLLTDGEPNVYPPAGYIPQLQKYKKMFKDFYFTLHTYAFGKYIDTNLLDQYALLGNGQYCFIPCPGFIGTIFVNSVSNILNTMASQCVLEIQPLNGSVVEEIPGGLPQEKNVIQVGDLKFDQPREVIVKMKIPEEVKKQKLPFLTVTVRYFDYVNKQKKNGESPDNTYQDWSDPLVTAHLCRVKFWDITRLATKQMGEQKQEEQAQQTIANFSQFLQEKLTELSTSVENLKQQQNQEYQIHRHEWALSFITNLKKDVDKEVTMAFKRTESFNHWGKHYIPSISHAHLKQQCNNFIDPGVQGYGGKFFNEIKDQVELTFLKLPAPKPSVRKDPPQQQQQQQQQYQQQQQAKPQQPPPEDQPEKNDAQDQVDMGAYYNCGGGCFDGKCLVLMADGKQKEARYVKKGDLVMGQDGTTACKVLYAVEILNSKNKFLSMVEMDGGLKITPKHPVMNQLGQWIKPASVKKPKQVECQSVFNFVLEKGHILNVNNVLCCTLGHMFSGENVEHPYFGTQKVVEDLKKIENSLDQKNQIIQIQMEDFARNEKNQQVCGIIQQKQQNQAVL